MLETIGHGFHQDLGLWPGDEDLGGDSKRKRKEFGLPQDLLEGHPFPALLDCGAQALLLGRSEGLVGAEGEFGPAGGEESGKKPFGVGLRFGDAGGPESIDSPGEGAGDGCGNGGRQG